MFKNINYKKALSLALAFTVLVSCFFISSNTVKAVSESSLRENKNELAQKKAQVSAQLEKAKKNTQDAQALHQAYENQIAVVVEQIDATEAEITTLNQQINVLQAEIVEIRNKIQQNEESLKENVIIDYKSGGTSFIDVLLGSNDDITDLIDKVSILNFVVENRSEAINQMNSDISTMQQKSSELGSKQKDLQAAKSQNQAQYKELKKLSDESQIQVDRLQKEQNTINNTLKQVESDLDQANKFLQEYIKQQEQKNIPEENIPVPSAGGWVVPISRGKYRISSPFGDTYGRGQAHEGIDLAASSYTPILAANNGVVTFAGWINGYGNSVMIKHSNGYYTLYAHMSTIGTSEGASVSAGSTIGAVGNTGNSTGPHLHFGVYTKDPFITRNFHSCCINPASLIKF